MSSSEDGSRANDDVKAKFREALEKKNANSRAAAGQGAHEDGKVHAAHGPEAHQRQFRRKSG